jgi:putative PIN family toxin of toxin-antitoxin system
MSGKKAMYRVVFDTNIFVSGTATITSNSPQSQIINAWRGGAFVLVTSPQILAEVKDVLLRPTVMYYTGLSVQEVHDFLAEVEKRAYVTEGVYEVWKIQTDPDDNIILACALEGYASHIVTGDTKSLLPLKEYHEIKIVTAADFLRVYLSKP